MKFGTTNRFNLRTAKQRVAGFTLAEVLAALVFMAIVIPVAVHGLQIATRAGEVAQRKAIAARIAERILTEAIVMHQYAQAGRRATVQEGPYEFNYTTRLDRWDQEPLRQLSVEVTYSVQGTEQSVRLSSLVDMSQP
jgi:type II secretory pathway component PulJ